MSKIDKSASRKVETKNLQILSLLFVISTFGSFLVASFMADVLSELLWIKNYMIYMLTIVVSMLIMLSGILIEVFPILISILKKDTTNLVIDKQQRSNIAWSIFMVGFVICFACMIFFGIYFSICALQYL
ncbi:MAG: hypothetical protein ACTSQE_01405 [Candidatus Heimdallarchaeaceae archaeon]